MPPWGSCRPSRAGRRPKPPCAYSAPPGKDQCGDGDEWRQHIDDLRWHVERAELGGEHARSAEQQRCGERPEGPARAQEDGGEREKASACRHVGLEEGEVA